MASKPQGTRLENGDILGADNDGDGRKEPILVSSYTKKDGTYVPEHARANPKLKHN